MALWDDLGRKAFDTKTKAVQQAKALSDITRLNAVISEEKKKIENYYYALGKSYAQLHKEDYEEALGEFMLGIADAERIIKESQEQIRDIKGVQTCEKCGAELVKDSAFCRSCGAPVPKPVVPVGPVCSGCGAPLSDGMRFCVSCGKPVEQKTEEPEEVPAGVCPKCGVKLEEGAAFCVNCGTKIG